MTDEFNELVYNIDDVVLYKTFEKAPEAEQLPGGAIKKTQKLGFYEVGKIANIVINRNIKNLTDDGVRYFVTSPFAGLVPIEKKQIIKQIHN